MANYLSKPIETLPPTSSINTQLIAQVQGAKQGQYNLAKQQINQTLDAFENLKVLRPQDQAYIEAKLTDLKSKLDNSAYKDLSDINLSDNLMSQIKTAAKDPFIVDAMANTAKFNNFQQQLAQLKEKKPELYNDANYAYAMWKGGVQDYIDGKSNGIGNLNYTNYTDLTEEHLKKLKTIKDLKGKRFIEQADGQGRIYRKEIDGLTDVEIQNYFSSILTPQELEQMKINGWAKYGQNPQEAQKLVKSFYGEKIKWIDEKIKINESKLNTNITPSNKEFLNKEIESLKEDRLNITEGIKNIGNIPVDLLSLELEKSSYLNGLSQIAKSEWSSSMKADDVFFKMKDLEIKYEELELKKLKLAQEAGLNSDGTTAGVSVSSREGDLKDVDGLKTLEKDHDRQYNAILDVGRKIIADGGADAELFIAELEAVGLDRNLNWIEGHKNATSQFSKAATIKAVFDKSNLAESYKQEDEILNKAYAEKVAIAKDIIKVESESYLETFNKNADKYIKGFEKMYKDLPKTRRGENDIIGNLVVGAYDENLNKEVEDFIKKAGGINNIKNYLQSNPKSIKIFADLTDKLDKKYKGIPTGLLQSMGVIQGWSTIVADKDERGIYTMSDVNLKEDSKKIIEDKLKSGGTSTFTAYNSVNIANEKAVSNIVNTLPADRIEGQVFDVKKPITVYKSGDKLVIEQFAGSNVSSKGVVRKSATIELDKGDAAYQILQDIVDIEQQKVRGYNFSTKDYNFQPIYPKKISAKDRTEAQRNSSASMLDNISISLNIFDGVKASSYLDDKSIKNTFTSYLTKMGYEETEVDGFIQGFIEQLPNFSVRPIKENTVVNGQKTPQMSLEIQNSIVGYSDTPSTGSTIVPDDFMYIVRNFPQTIIAHRILKQIIENKPKNLNEVYGI